MQTPVKIRTRYDERSPSGLRFNLPSRVKQEFAKESDINQQVGRFLKTGILPQATIFAQHPRFGDFSEVVEYQDSLNRIMRFEEDFMSLPSQIRARFGNDPAELLNLIETNPEEAKKLGITVGTSLPLDVTGPVDTGEEKPSSVSPVPSNPEV